MHYDIESQVYISFEPTQIDTNEFICNKICAIIISAIGIGMIMGSIFTVLWPYDIILLIGIFLYIIAIFHFMMFPYHEYVNLQFNFIPIAIICLYIFISIILFFIKYF